MISYAPECSPYLFMSINLVYYYLTGLVLRSTL